MISAGPGLLLLAAVTIPFCQIPEELAVPGAARLHTAVVANGVLARSSRLWMLPREVRSVMRLRGQGRPGRLE